MVMSPFDRHISHVITGRAVLFVGGVVFLIDDNESQIVERQKDRTSGPNYDPYFSILYPLILFVAFLITQFGMVEDHIIKTLFDSFDHLRR